jgi:hypothetical protein
MADEPDRLDAPNQQVVRPDGSGPGDEGDGGSAPPEAEQQTTDPDQMTKAELLEEADRRGVRVGQDATKADIRKALG